MVTTVSPATDLDTLDHDYRRVERAIQYLEDKFTEQPSLEDVARVVGLSEFHFQRLFGRWVGISPKRFLQFLTKEYAKEQLERSRSVLEAAYEAGLSSPSRLHDLFLAAEAVTPGQYQSHGAELQIAYGFHPTPFGRCMVASTERGVCALRFLHVPGRSPEERDNIEWLRQHWPEAELRRNPEATGRLVSAVFADPASGRRVPLHVHIRGTNFQLKVWEALLEIPPGSMVTYSDVARRIGSPTASRAVGNAVGDNPVPFLIPCHRVIRSTGMLGNYGEGRIRKKAILGWEAAHFAG